MRSRSSSAPGNVGVFPDRPVGTHQIARSSANRIPRRPGTAGFGGIVVVFMGLGLARFNRREIEESPELYRWAKLRFCGLAKISGSNGFLLTRAGSNPAIAGQIVAGTPPKTHRRPRFGRAGLDVLARRSPNPRRPKWMLSKRKAGATAFLGPMRAPAFRIQRNVVRITVLKLSGARPSRP